MPIMRIELTDDENKRIMQIKRDKLKIPYVKQLLMDAVAKEEKRLEKSNGHRKT